VRGDRGFAGQRLSFLTCHGELLCVQWIRGKATDR